MLKYFPLFLLIYWSGYVMHRTTVWAIYVTNIWTLPFFWTLNMNSFFLKLNTFIQWNKWIHSYLSDKLLCLNMNSDINFIILISAFQLLTKIFLFRLFWVEWNGRFIVCVFYIILWKIFIYLIQNPLFFNIDHYSVCLKPFDQIDQMDFQSPE